MRADENTGTAEMVDFGSILPALFAFAIATSAPGPANIATAMIAVRHGRRAGLLLGLGLSVGLAFWGIIAATGLGAVLQGSEIVLTALKILGGLYLVWLAIQSWRSAESQPTAKVDGQKDRRWFMVGLLLNLTNPKAVFAWIAALSLGLGIGDSTAQVVLATALCVFWGCVNYTLYALAFSLPKAMDGYRQVHKWVGRIVAGIFLLAGFGLIRSAITRQ